MKQHKWHKEIIHWANGGEIECRVNNAFDWFDVEEPSWHSDFQFRIKPEPKEPKYLYVYIDNNPNDVFFTYDNNTEISYGLKYIGKIKLEE